jgi:uncharacterized membrane protein
MLEIFFAMIMLMLASLIYEIMGEYYFKCMICVITFILGLLLKLEINRMKPRIY